MNEHTVVVVSEPSTVDSKQLATEIWTQPTDELHFKQILLESIGNQIQSSHTNSGESDGEPEFNLEKGLINNAQSLQLSEFSEATNGCPQQNVQIHNVVPVEAPVTTGNDAITQFRNKYDTVKRMFRNSAVNIEILSTIIRERQQLESFVDGMESDQVKLIATLLENEQTIAQLNKEKANHSADYDSLVTTLNSCKNQINGDLQKCQDKVNSVELSLRNKTAECERRFEENESLKAELISIKQENEKLKLPVVEVESLKSQITAHDKTITSLKKDLSKRKKELKESKKDADEFRCKTESLQSRINSVELSLQSKTTECGRHFEENESLKAELIVIKQKNEELQLQVVEVESLKGQISAHGNTIVSLKNDLSKRKKELKESKNDVDEFRNQTETLQSQINFLVSENQRMISESLAVKEVNNIVTQKDDEIRGQKKKLVKQQTELNQLHQTFLQKQQENYALNEDKQRLLEEISKWKHSLAQIKKEKEEKINQLEEALFNKKQELESANNLLSERNEITNFLNLEIEDKKRWLNQKIKENNDLSLNNQRDREKLVKQLKEKDGRIQKLNEMVKEEQNKVASLEQNLATKDFEINANTNVIKTQNDKIGQLMKDNMELNEKLASSLNWEQECSNLTKRIDWYECQLSAGNKRVARFRKDISVKNTRIKKLEKASAKARRTYVDQMTETDHLNFKAIEDEIKKKDECITSLQKQLYSAVSNFTTSQDELHFLKEDNGRLRANRNKAWTPVRCSGSDVKKNHVVDKLKSQLSYKDRRINRITEYLEEERNKVSSLQEEIDSLETKYCYLRNEVDRKNFELQNYRILVGASPSLLSSDVRSRKRETLLPNVQIL